MVESRLIKTFIRMLEEISVEEIMEIRKNALDIINGDFSRESKSDARLSIRLIEEELIARKEVQALKKQ